MFERHSLRLHWPDLFLALGLPVAALILQGLLWPWLNPYVWFLFHPAVFFGMPRISGLEVLAALRGNPRTRLLPVDFTGFVEAVARVGAHWALLDEPAQEPRP